MKLPFWLPLIAGFASAQTRPVAPGDMVMLAFADPGPGRTELYAGRTKLKILAERRRAGKREVTFRAPETEGCFVPIHLAARGRLQADSVSLAIARSGPCPPDAIVPIDSRMSGRIAMTVRVHGQEWSLETGKARSTVNVAALFLDGSSTSFRPGPLLRLPPAGLCSSGRGQYAPGTPTVDVAVSMALEDVSGVELDAGPFLALDDGRYQTRIPKVVGREGIYWSTVATLDEEFLPLNIKSGFNIRAPGGRDVKPFAMRAEPPEPFDWIEPPATPLVDVRKDFRLAWKTTVNGTVLVALAAVDSASARFSYCLCIAPVGEDQFSIPSRLVSSLHSALGASRDAAGVVYLIHLPPLRSTKRTEQFEKTAQLSLQAVTARVLLHR